MALQLGEPKPFPQPQLGEPQAVRQSNANAVQRDRSHSPRRERSRSRSRERYRESRRDRSQNGYHEEEDRSYDRRGAPPANRGAGREERMNAVRENSQQDRRVYVGNLPYEVTWQALKSFMKEGKQNIQSLSSS